MNRCLYRAMMTLLLAMLLGSVASAHSPDTILDDATGCIVRFPDHPDETTKTDGGVVSHSCVLSTTSGYFAAAFLSPKSSKARAVGVTVHRTLKELKELFVPLQFVDTAQPIVFGSCPGYAFEGKTDNGAKQKGRVLQVLNACILLTYASDSGTFPPECDAFLDSLTFAVEGIRPGGRQEVSAIPGGSGESKNGGFFTTPILDLDPTQSSTYTRGFNLTRDDTLYTAVCQFPQPNKAADFFTGKRLEQARDELTKGMGLKKSRERRFRIGPTEGIEWECKVGSTGGVRARVFLLGDALYSLIYASKSFDSDKADAFLNSIHLVFGKPF